MKCNLLVPGFAKCATSSLHKYLDLHPEICMSSRKEPHYFSLKAVYEKGASWHDSLFDHADENSKFFGESSTSYSTWEPALVRIKKELIRPRIILILRDPLERLLSHYRWMYAIGFENEKLPKALKVEAGSPVDIEISRGGCYPWYFRKSKYSYFVPLIEIIFGEENVLLIRTEDLAQKPSKVMDYCFNFLQVDAFDIGESRMEFNKTANKRVQNGASIVSLHDKLPSRFRHMIKPYYGKLLTLLGKRKRVAPEPSDVFLDDLRALLEDDFKEYSRATAL
ncbi:MAG: sulfotransferase domain-containing protein [Verrucomicrobiota bacterium]